MEVLSSDTNFETICDLIHQLLLLKKSWRLVIGGILDHVIKNKDKMFLDLDKQLLLYIRDESGMGKNGVLNVIQIGFILLGRGYELVISVPTSSAVNGISGSMIHIAAYVRSRAGKNYQTKVNI